MDLHQKARSLPQTPGVYLFKKNGGVLYVGKAINLRNRVESYFAKASILDPKAQGITSEADEIDYIRVQSDFEALLLEASLIKKYLPKFNIKAKDDKSFLYIAITKDKFPQVLTARKNDFSSKQAFLFGPFPSAKTTKYVLKILRRIFPFCSQKISKKACFYSHLGLCRPCPSGIVKEDKDIQIILRKEYLSNIRHLKQFLDGRDKKLIYELEKEMNHLSKEQNYEEAAILRDKINKLKQITSPGYKISFYLENPNFLSDQSEKESELLQNILEPYFENLKELIRIEAYDISNIQGKNGTGSMVTFENGLPDKSYYRRFKIRNLSSPNDVGMMREILERRLSHPEWEFPNLIMVDGGKGQIHTVMNVLAQKNLDIPVVGLAKRLETLIIPKGDAFIEKNLPTNSEAINLLKRIRDEAHRFAREYHLKLRNLS